MPDQRKLEERAQKQLVAMQRAELRAREAREAAEAKERGTRERAKLQKKAADLEKKLAVEKRDYKLYKGVADGTISKEEEKKTISSIRRHKFYDFVKFFVDIPKRFNPCTKEDTVVQHGDAALVNKGRIYLGGTKPMFEYVAENDPNKRYLFKEAITCVGTSKPEGALVCESAYRLQQAINPRSAIETFTKVENGRVLGSFQEKVAVDGNAIDLFKWQDQPNAPQLEKPLADQILREHTVDWLICNFDTKGENFVIDNNASLRGIDKEQAFSFLDDPKAQRMDRNYQPNPNNTLYNVIFDRFAKGQQDLDLQQVIEPITAVERMSRDEYLGLFTAALDAKSKGNPEKRAQMEARLVGRRDNLREEYRRFFTELVEERCKDNPEQKKDYLDENGEFVFNGEGRMTVHQNEQAMQQQANERSMQQDMTQEAQHDMAQEVQQDMTQEVQQSARQEQQREAHENKPVRELISEDEKREILGKKVEKMTKPVTKEAPAAEKKAMGMGGK